MYYDRIVGGSLNKAVVWYVYLKNIERLQLAKRHRYQASIGMAHGVFIGALDGGGCNASPLRHHHPGHQ